ncbi:hypothetical protein XO10_02580 [Marinitoga sp. 1135]|nr:hypothetical protein LN42_02890 [Marinitoga sp. 1137]NUU95369.1 hypothetical protein [Marinitoga sp. 1135]NUU97297.1 hypothetical protein [Marinitoga sp. 1138]
MIEIKNISYSYDGNHNVLENINFSIPENSYFGIYGHSGSGKSTLLFLIGNLLKIQTGTIEYNFEFHKKKIGFVFQFFNLINELTIFENARLAQLIRVKKENKNEIMDYANLLGIESIINKYPHEISGGEQQRASILRAIVGDTKIILADEPTGSLDLKNKEIVFNLFKELKNIGKTIVVVSHESKLLQYCDYSIKLENGKIKETGGI